MNDLLCAHASYIIEDCARLLQQHDARLNSTQITQIQRIQANAVEFKDVWERLMSMPLHEITSILNHDVRNIITPIFGYAELISTEVVGVLSPSQLAAAERINQNAHVLLDEMNRVLAQAASKHVVTAIAS